MTKKAKNLGEKLKESNRKNPRQTKQEVFVSTDSQGYVNNRAGQEEYPGLKKHKPKENENEKENNKAPLFTEKDIEET